MILSKTEHDQFARDGFLGPFDLPAGIVDRYASPAYTDSLLARLRARDGSDALRNQHLHSRSIYELATEPSVLSRVSAILGPDVLLWVAHLLFRAAGDKGQPWHVDSINQYIRGLHLSVAVSDNDQNNGCLYLIPGSHLYRASLQAAQQIGRVDLTDADAALRYADETAPWNRPHRIVAMELRAGQFFFTWGGLWHSVGPNASGGPRLAFVARYARPDVACRHYGYSDAEIVPGDPLPCIVVAGSDAFGLNQLSPSPTADLFEPPHARPGSD